MLCLGMVSTNFFRLSCAGEIQNLNRRWKWQRTIIFLHVGEICKRRQSCCSTVPRTGSTDTSVCGGFAVVHALSVDEHKHSPARIRYSNKVLYTMFRTTHRLCIDVLSFIGCQTSTNFELASLGMRGAQERALLVPDDNIGTYGSCTII